MHNLQTGEEKKYDLIVSPSVFDSSKIDFTRIPINTIAKENSVLYLWYKGDAAIEAIRLTEFWGFKLQHLNAFSWVKIDDRNRKRLTRRIRKYSLSNDCNFIELLNYLFLTPSADEIFNSSEYCLVASRGSGLKLNNLPHKQIIYSFTNPESYNPISIRKQLQKIYGDVNRLELFSEKRLHGWDCWNYDLQKMKSTEQKRNSYKGIFEIINNRKTEVA